MRGRLRPGLSPDDPEVARALEAWDGPRYVSRDAEGADVVLLSPAPGPGAARLALHLALFLLTVFTTLMAGALLAGLDPLGTRFVRAAGTVWPVPTTVDWRALATGAPFAVPLLAILLAHEMGHWLAARRHGVPATLPFFIPFPAYWSLVGTLGAFIRVRGPIVRRSVLFDIGAAGPAASFLLSIPVATVGLALSRSVPGDPAPATPYVIQFAGEAFFIGSGALFEGMARLALPGSAEGLVLLHPVAFAGWLGLFVTALNLLPFGQLDGGHILYAAVGGRQRWVGRVFLAVLLPLGVLWWGWWIWAMAAVVLSRGRVAHPPVLQDDVRLDRPRRLLAWSAFLVFFLSFTPVPLRF